MYEPKLFLDVDGCLLVEKDPGGYVQFDHHGQTFWYAPETPKRIQAIDVLYDIYVCSHQWEHHVRDIAKLLEIDTKWEVVHYEVHTPKDGVMRPEKLAEIKQLYDGPAAIVDDRMGPAVEEWASDKICLLIQPDERVGLTKEQTGLLLSFGEVYSIQGGSEGELMKDFLRVPDGPVLSQGEWF